MKNKYQVVPQNANTKKPAKVEVSDAEFRRQLKNISEWRKKRLAQLRAKDSRCSLRPDSLRARLSTYANLAHRRIHRTARRLHRQRECWRPENSGSATKKSTLVPVPAGVVTVILPLVDPV